MLLIFIAPYEFASAECEMSNIEWQCTSYNRRQLKRPTNCQLAKNSNRKGQRAIGICREKYRDCIAAEAKSASDGVALGASATQNSADGSINAGTGAEGFFGGTSDSTAKTAMICNKLREDCINKYQEYLAAAENDSATIQLAIDTNETMPNNLEYVAFLKKQCQCRFQQFKHAIDGIVNSCESGMAGNTVDHAIVAGETNVAAQEAADVVEKLEAGQAPIDNSTIQETQIAEPQLLDASMEPTAELLTESELMPPESMSTSLDDLDLDQNIPLEITAEVTVDLPESLGTSDPFVEGQPLPVDSLGVDPNPETVVADSVVPNEMTSNSAVPVGVNQTNPDGNSVPEVKVVAEQKSGPGLGMGAVVIGGIAVGGLVMSGGGDDKKDKKNEGAPKVTKKGNKFCVESNGGSEQCYSQQQAGSMCDPNNTQYQQQHQNSQSFAALCVSYNQSIQSSSGSASQSSISSPGVGNDVSEERNSSVLTGDSVGEDLCDSGMLMDCGALEGL